MTEFQTETARFRHPNGTLHKFRVAFPVGAQQHDACRWSHIDECDVRTELFDVREGDTVFVLGSSFGSYALAALAAGARHVHCFNPNAAEMDVLRASMLANGWQERWTPHLVGLYSSSGYLSDQSQAFKPGETGDFVIAEDDGKYTQRFKVTTLDSLALPEPEGRSIWMCDVEGAEVEVVKGAASFLSRVAPAFCLFEEHKFKSEEIPKKLEAQMVFAGYKLATRRPYHSGCINHALFVPEEA